MADARGLRNQSLYPTAAKTFVEEVGTLRTPASKRTYLDMLRTLQNAYPGKRVSEFRQADLVSWCLAANAPATVKQRRKIAMAFFQWAAFKEWVTRDPSAGLQHVVNPKVHPVRQHNWLEQGDANRVIDAVDTSTDAGKRDRILLLILVCTGLRRMELAQLRWGQVNLSAGTIRLVGKGEKPATVGFNNRLREALFEWRSECARGLGRPPAADDPVIPRGWKTGWGEPTVELFWDRPIGDTGIHHLVRKAGERVGIPGLNPHDLRRTFADLMLEQTGDIYKVKEALRHSSVATTEAYLAKSPRRAIAAGQAFAL